MRQCCSSSLVPRLKEQARVQAQLPLGTMGSALRGPRSRCRPRGPSWVVATRALPRAPDAGRGIRQPGEGAQ
eukprot:11916932-Alexandrium_andersonii.AAC.1